VRQERPNINVTLGPPGLVRFRVMNHRDQPIPILANIKNHVSLDVVGILEHIADLGEIMPANFFNDGRPCTNLLCRIGILFGSIVQMPSRDDVHWLYFTSQYVKFARTPKTAGRQDRRCSVTACLLNGMEPTIGLEPMTCRLRKDPTLRMLL